MAWVAGSVGGLHHREKLEGIAALSMILPAVRMLETRSKQKRSASRRYFTSRHLVPYGTQKSHFVRNSFALRTKFEAIHLTETLIQLETPRNEKDNMRCHVRTRDNQRVVDFLGNLR